MLTNVRAWSATLASMPLVRSWMTMFVYLTQARTNVWPDGQTSVDASGPTKMLLSAPRATLTRPLVGLTPTVGEVIGPFTLCLFAAFGWLPPPLMQA
jgi:hypothetical protein